jgi:hypothetical protein
LNRSIFASAHQSNRFRCLADGSIQNVFRGSLRNRRVLVPVFHVVFDDAERPRNERLQTERR